MFDLRDLSLERADFGTTRFGEQLLAASAVGPWLAIMSLIQSARTNGHDPRAYIDDVRPRLATCQNSRVAELAAHNSQCKSLAA